MKTLVVEPSTHPHTVEGDIQGLVERGSDLQFTTEKGVVKHGEHGAFVVKGNVRKCNQQEYNPVTRAMQAAFD
jgi:hypothetical protein